MSEESFVEKYAGEDSGKAQIFLELYREVVADLLASAEDTIRRESDREYEHGHSTDQMWQRLGIVKASVRYAHELAKNSRMASQRRLKAQYELDGRLRHP
ncbi:MAG: hypothetical protein WC026_14485 [Hyphomicrobium sp.]|uniref:hypothetical protein n=1 Tax=Hyphomicrobium sp. TaxID=82 RepID=UPI00356AB7CA